MMENFKNDIAVLFIFFVRAEQTSKVFEQIRIARPSKLFLYQDGPRPNREDDIEGIKALDRIQITARRPSGWKKIGDTKSDMKDI